MIVLKLSDRKADTLATICEMYAENNNTTHEKVFISRKGYKFRVREFVELERELWGKI